MQIKHAHSFELNLWLQHNFLLFVQEANKLGEGARFCNFKENSIEIQGHLIENVWF